MKVNGSLFLNSKMSVRDLFSEQTWSQIVGSLQQEENKKLLGDIVLSASWHDLEIYNDLLQAMVQVVGVKGLEQISRKNAERQLSGIFSVILRFISLETVLQRMNKLWGTCFSEGKMELQSSDKNSYNILIDGMVYSPEHHIANSAYMDEIARRVTRKKCQTRVIKKSAGQTILKIDLV